MHAPDQLLEFELSNKRQVYIRAMQVSTKILNFTHHSVCGFVAGLLGVLLIEDFSDLYDLNPKSISRTPANIAVLTATATLLAVAYVKAAPPVNDELAAYNPELDLDLLSTVNTLKDSLINNKNDNAKYIETVSILRKYIEFMITEIAINESRFFKYVLYGMKYFVPVNEILLGFLSGIAINGALVNYGTLFNDSNSNLFNASAQFKIIAPYCFVPGVAALLKFLLKHAVPRPIQLNVSLKKRAKDIETGKTALAKITLPAVSETESLIHLRDALLHVFPDFEREKLPKLGGWDASIMLLVVGMNTLGNIGMLSWWLPIMLSWVGLQTSKLMVGGIAGLLAINEIKYQSIHALKVKALALVVSLMPGVSQKESIPKIDKKKKWSVALAAFILIGVNSLLNTIGISDVYAHFFTKNTRLDRDVLGFILLFFSVCNLAIFLTNSRRASHNQKFERFLEDYISKAFPFLQNRLAAGTDSAGTSPEVVVHMPGSEPTGLKDVMLENKNTAKSTHINIESGAGGVGLSQANINTVKRLAVDITEDVTQPTSTTPLLADFKKTKSHQPGRFLGCGIM